MTAETKVLVGVLAATVAIIVGGAFFFARPGAPEVRQPVAQPERLVREDSLVLGATDPKVTVVEFGDFQCAACGAVHPILKALKEAYRDKPVRFVYRQYPLTTIHEFAQGAAEASLAAGAHGKFWEYHDLLFENQTSLQRADLEKYATHLGLDLAAFRQALDDHTYREAVKRDVDDGIALGVRGTPTIFVNNVQYTGAYSVEAFRAVIDAALNT